MTGLKKIFFLALLAGFSLPLLYAQKTLPAFSFVDLEGEIVTVDALEEGLPTIAFFFDPYCDHCAQQAEWIVAEEEAFKDIQMIWVTTEEVEPTLAFKEKYFDQTELERVYILRDPEYMFDAYFGYSEVPSIYIFNREGRKVKSFTKETPAEILLKFL